MVFECAKFGNKNLWYYEGYLFCDNCIGELNILIEEYTKRAIKKFLSDSGWTES
jgi:hypothetical protein